MSKIIIRQNNFNAGELSPRLYGHTDLDKYKNGLKTATNLHVLPHGPFRRRNGFQYIAEVKTSSTAVRLLRFQYSQTSAYILELGNQYMRFYKSGAQIKSGGSPVELATPWTTSELWEVTYVQYANVIYFAHEDYAPRKLTWTDDTTWTIEAVGFYPEPSREDGYAPATTLTPAATSGTSVVFTAGSSVFLKGDVGRQLINNADGETGVASITAYTSGTQVTAEILETFTDTNPIASGDWKMDLSPIADLTPDGTKVGAIVTLDADESSSVTALDTFRSNDIGDYVRIHNGIVEITQVVSASQIKGEVQKALDAKDETDVWTLEQPAWSSTNGYPRTVTLHEQRLIFGSTSADPQTLWLSEAGVFENIGVGSDDSDAISVDIATAEVNQIQWMLSVGGSLAVGTAGSEMTISNGGGAGSLTPSNITSQSQTYEGSNIQQPVYVGNEAIYIQRSGTKINAFRYSFEIDTYTNDELTFLAEHMTVGGIKELAVAKDPDRTIYAVLNSGDMLAGTYMREQKVLGWTRFTTDGSFESVQTISTGTEDEVWCVINRTIDGGTVRYIERLDTGDGTDYLHGYSDSFLTYSAPKTITAITAANPGVVTAASHGFSNGDKVKLIDVGGMTEVIGTTFVVAGQTTNTFKLENLTKTSIVNSTYAWHASGSGTNEYYLELSGGGDPSISNVTGVYQNSAAMTEGTAGSLSASEWDYADNDSLGYSTIYVRLSDGADPDSKTTAYVQYGSGVNTTSYTAYTSGGEAHKLVTTLSGLDHLEGETVEIKADGAAHSAKTVSSGAITLDRDTYEATVGLPYTMTATMLDQEFTTGRGSQIGQPVRWVRPIVKLYKSVYPTLNGEFLPARSAGDKMDNALTLFSGDAEYGNYTWQDGSALSFAYTGPFPCMVLSISGTVDTGIK